MLPAVHFNDQALFPADKVDNIRPDRFLPYELMALY
jgi:hypothetical protein